jgi:hypothetical protein
MKSYHLQVNGWNWRTSTTVRLARLRRSKIVCSPSYASRANAVMFWTCMWESTYSRNGDRQETQNLKVFDVPTAEELIQ